SSDLDFFRKHNADLISLQENIDTSSPAGRLFYNLCGVFAQWEREEITDRVRASVAIRAKLGKPLGGKAAFGYVWKDKHLEPDPQEAPVRKLIYELFSEHRRKKTVARLLNERGYRTRNGGKWTDTSIDRLIRDTTAKGIYRANYTERIDGNSYKIKPEHEWVLSEVEPIITDELWNRCNDLLEGRKTRNERPGRKPVHLFAGLVICECGKKLYVPSNTPKYVCFTCRNKIPVADLEGLFLDELKGYLLSPESVAAYLDRMNSAGTEKEHLIESLQKERERVGHESDCTYRLYLDGGLTTDQFKERYQPLDARKKQIEEELPRLEAELSLIKIDGLSQEEIMREALNLHGRWETMAGNERRQLVELLIRTIVVGRDEVTFNICYIPRIEELTERQRTVRDSWRLPA
ncbi:MAG: Site-specific recombinase, partial [Bryobacterales bacterium]|nr:Site-specific recombinase [Bryobacterales bacterium]